MTVAQTTAPAEMVGGGVTRRGDSNYFVKLRDLAVLKGRTGRTEFTVMGMDIGI